MIENLHSFSTYPPGQLTRHSPFRRKVSYGHKVHDF